MLISNSSKWTLSLAGLEIQHSKYCKNVDYTLEIRGMWQSTIKVMIITQ